MGELLAPLSGRAAELKKSLEDFVETKCIPAEELFESQLGQGANRWKVVPAVMEELKVEARRRGLWNLWLPKEFPQGAGLTNSEYAVLAEVTGRSALAPEACNCSAPDTGNMEVLLRYGTPAQKNRWLDPLLRGEIRSAFLMTEPAVASSDATNVSCTFRRRPASKGGGYVVDGVKWWSSGAMDPRCAVAIVLGKIVEEEEEEEGEGAGGSRSGSGSGGSGGGGGGRPRGRRTQQTMLLVPMDAPGVRIVRALTVFGYDDAPHGHAEVALEGVEVRKFTGREGGREGELPPYFGSSRSTRTYLFPYLSSSFPSFHHQFRGGGAGGSRRAAAGRGSRVRHRAGTARAGPRAPLHAGHRPHGAGPPGGRRPRRRPHPRGLRTGGCVPSFGGSGF
jgi:hypothetical protein